MTEAAALYLTYKYRLLPTKRQHRALAEILESQRQFYNAALQERIDCYRKTGRSIGLYEQMKGLTELRRDDADSAASPVYLQRATLVAVDEAMKGFFRRVKLGQKPGFPRFKGKARFRGFGFNEFKGIQLDGKRLRFKGLTGGLRVHLHRPLPPGAEIRACRLKRDVKGWSVCLQLRIPMVAPEEAPKSEVGIDLGLTHLATLSTGERIPAPRVAKRAAKELRRRQRQLARCRRGSNRRGKVKARVARLQHQVANARRTALHRISADLTRRFGRIAIEDLNVKGLARSRLAGSVHDASWATLTQLLRYKAARAGGEVVEVDPRGTTQACSGCGGTVVKTLSQRRHRCPACRLDLDRDHNAALNVLHLGVVAGGWRNVGHEAVRATVSLAVA